VVFPLVVIGSPSGSSAFMVTHETTKTSLFETVTAKTPVALWFQSRAHWQRVVEHFRLAASANL
jgi:hypothetical protein